MLSVRVACGRQQCGTAQSARNTAAAATSLASNTRRSPLEHLQALTAAPVAILAPDGCKACKAGRAAPCWLQQHASSVAREASLHSGTLCATCPLRSCEAAGCWLA